MIEGLLRTVLEEAQLLGLSWWERIGVILALALLLVLAKAGIRGIASIRLPPPVPLPDYPPSDGSAPGDVHGVPLPTDPEHPGGEFPGGG